MRTLAVICFLMSSAGVPANVSADDNRDFFEVRIRPLLIKHCLACHGSKKQESGLRLDTRAGWARGGELGPALVPGKPSDSRLIQAVTYSDPSLKMPPRGKLSPTEIADLTRWIQRGAFDPRKLTPDTATAKRMTLKQARSFWAFRPLTAPRVPKTPDTTSIQTPVDAFVWERLHHHGLSAVAPAVLAPVRRSGAGRPEGLEGRELRGGRWCVRILRGGRVGSCGHQLDVFLHRC